MFFRVLTGEVLKLRRTLALWTVLIAPAVVLLLQLLMYHQRSDYFARRGPDLWSSLTQNLLGLWALLMLPLFVTLETALLAGLEHSERQWKNLLALPVPRWEIYLAKLSVTTGMVAVSHLVLCAGGVGLGRLLPLLRPQLPFPGAIPWVGFLAPAARMLAGAMLLIAIHHWVSLRWQSFTVAVSVGMSAVVTSFMLINSPKWSSYFPWTFPAMSMGVRAPSNLNVIWVSVAGAILVTAFGVWEFRGREVE